MEVTLLGTGDTTGTPAVGCDCGTCERARELGVERTRFSVHVHDPATDCSLLIDASPDFRTQFLREDVALPDAVVITHMHFDHLDGLGNLYRLVDSAPVYAADETDPVTDESVAETIERRYDYLDSVRVAPVAPFESVSAAGFDVRLVPVVHPPLVSYGVVISNGDVQLSITGDTTYAIPEDSRAALSDSDLLLAEAIVPASRCEGHPLGGDDYHDGVAYTFGTKHTTREGALALADELDAGRVRLVHASHFYPPDEAFADPLAVDGERYAL
ncbi:ATP-binding protein [Halobacteriales archaeon SW_7_68_16]|nr:MAG: ATP-binding protein [Halobacteriales archaeon SW_7_68_16]